MPLFLQRSHDREICVCLGTIIYVSLVLLVYFFCREFSSANFLTVLHLSCQTQTSKDIRQDQHLSNVLRFKIFFDTSKYCFWTLIISVFLSKWRSLKIVVSIELCRKKRSVCIVTVRNVKLCHVRHMLHVNVLFYTSTLSFPCSWNIRRQ